MAEDGLRPIARVLSAGQRRYHGYGRKMDPLYDSFGELKPYTPSIRENIEGFIRNNWRGPNPETKTQDLMSILSWSPPGMLMDAYDAGRAGIILVLCSALLRLECQAHRSKEWAVRFLTSIISANQ